MAGNLPAKSSTASPARSQDFSPKSSEDDNDLGTVVQGSASSQMAKSFRLPDGSTISQEEAKSFALTLSHNYVKSYPGLNDAASNSYLHFRVHKLLNDGQEDYLQEIIENLSYRLSAISLCNRYRMYLGSDAEKFPRCDEVDCDIETRTPEVYQNQKHWMECWDLVCSRQNILFDKPIPGQGIVYHKPMQYLSLMLYKLNWHKDACIAALDHLARMKRRPSPIGISIDRFDIANMPAAKKQLHDIARSTKRQVRDFSQPESPTKKSVSTEDTDVKAGSQSA